MDKSCPMLPLPSVDASLNNPSPTPPVSPIRPQKNQWWLWLRAFIGLALLGWVFWHLKKQGAGDLDWQATDWRWLLAAVGMGGLSVLAWAGRWWWFLRVYGIRADYGGLLRLTLFADFFNLYFLGPLGADGIRLLLLSRRFPDRRGAIVGSLVLDHIGGIVGGAILYVLFSRSGILEEGQLETTDLAFAAYVGLTFLGLGVIMEPWLQRFILTLPGLGRLASWAQPLFAGSFRHPWLLAGFAVSAIGTACAYAAYWAAAQALGAQVALPAMLGLMPVVDAIASLPVTLSGIGIREGLLVAWMGDQPEVGAARALAVSILGFLALGLWGLAGGLWLAVSRHKPSSQTTA